MQSGLKIKYLTNIDIDNFDSEYLKEFLEKKFKNSYNKELNYGMTIYGPHRDDLVFEFNNCDLKYYGSQGQQKLSVLAFKLSEIPIFKDFSNTEPVLLLDDIFSELDLKKRNKLLKIISSYDIQSIITTTDLKNINKKYLEDAYIYEVKKGNIDRK